MLILTRKQGESLTIGDDIRIIVLGIEGRQIRLGIDTPLKVIIHRGEISRRTKEEQPKRLSNEDRDRVGAIGKAAMKLAEKIFPASKER